jgi:twinkle protein
LEDVFVQKTESYEELKNAVQEAKEQLGKRAIEIIAEDLGLSDIINGATKTQCIFHEDDNPSLVAYGEGYFHCFGCQKHYDIIDHYMEFYKLSFIEAAKKLFEISEYDFEFEFETYKEKKEYVVPDYDKNEDRTIVEDYLGKRGISAKTLDYCDVQQSKTGDNVVFNFYNEFNELTAVKYRPARKLNKDEMKCWFQKKGMQLSLFNMNRIDPTKPLLITEGEIDTLSAIEAGYQNTVSVPNGANLKWIETCFEWLEQFDKIIIWSDNDLAGIRMRRDACARLGIGRTYYVVSPEEYVDENGKKWKIKDINETLYCYGKDKIIELIENAQEMPIMGVDDLAQVDDFNLEEIEGLTPKMEPIKDIVYKFLFGSVLLVTGVRGAGKSTLINQLFVCDPLDDAYNVFMFSGELGAPVLRSWIERTLAGPEFVSLKDDFVHVISNDVKKKMREWYKGRIWIYSEPTNNSEDIFKKAIATTRKFGTKIWILDNLMTLDIGADDYNLNQKQKDFIVRLNKLALQYNVLAVLVTHPRKLMRGADMTTDDISGSGDLGNMAQYILKVRRFSKDEKDRGEEYDQEIEIMKNRYTGKLGKAKVFFDYTSYRFHTDWENGLYSQYKWDMSTDPINYKPFHQKISAGPYDKDY